MWDGRRELVRALREHAATLGPEQFVYRTMVEAAVAVQVERARQYILPLGGYVDRLDGRDQTPGSSRIIRLPYAEIFFEWHTKEAWRGALCFTIDGASNIASMLPPYWRLFFPREFAPRRGTLALVPFRLDGQKFVLPEVAMIFGGDEFFWRDGASRKPIRTSLVVRDPLCVANPTCAFLSRAARAEFELYTPACKMMLSDCAYCAGVVESFCGLPSVHK